MLNSLFLKKNRVGLRRFSHFNVFEVKHIPNISDTNNRFQTFKTSFELCKRDYHTRSQKSVSYNGKTWLHSPSVVLSVEQEVRTHDGDAHGHDAQDDQDQHHEAVHIVDFVGPKRCEDEVPEERGATTCHRLLRSSQHTETPQYNSKDLHFNENGPKWKDSSEADDDSRLHEPEWAQQTTWVWLFTVKVPHQISSSRAKICDLLCSEKEKGKCGHNWGNSSKVWH